ncbi:MAG: thioesterase domain-containing protein [Mucilaginibacter sp.]
MKRAGNEASENSSRAESFKSSIAKKVFTELETGKYSISHISLVPIQPNGDKLPLYIVHGAGLDVQAFNHIGTYMDNEQPIFGLQARGINCIDEPSNNLKEIAHQYIQEIILHDSKGPYLLAGYSFGGHVVVEMRKQLIAMGKPIKRVIILDTNAEKTEVKNQYLILHKKIIRNLPKLLLLLRSATKRLAKTFTNASKPPHEKQRQNELKSKEYAQHIKKIMDMHHVALKEYVMEPFDDKIYLIKARISVHYANDTEFLGWQKYAKKGVAVHLVPGDHLSMLLPPNIREFGAILQEILNKNH